MMIPETQDMIDACRNIKRWHYDRNLIDGATDKDQVCKLIQEVGELSDNVCKGKDIRDDIGDIIVVLINIAERHGVSLTECMQHAYNDIKDRKGRMVDGVFVKEEDDEPELHMESSIIEVVEETYTAMQAAIDQANGDLSKLV